MPEPAGVFWPHRQNENASDGDSSIALGMVRDSVEKILKESVHDPLLNGVIHGAKAEKAVEDPAGATKDALQTAVETTATKLLKKYAPAGAKVLERSFPVIWGLLEPTDTAPASSDMVPVGPPLGSPTHRHMQLFRKWMENQELNHSGSVNPDIAETPNTPQISPR